jgi:hypothetical protein
VVKDTVNGGVTLSKCGDRSSALGRNQVGDTPSVQRFIHGNPMATSEEFRSHPAQEMTIPVVPVRHD